jgi:hypothetical protein
MRGFESWRGALAPLGLAALLLASSPAPGRTNECVDECEANYKACSTNRKQSETACRAQLEKCRKVCLKRLDEGEKDYAPPPKAVPPKSN